MRVLVVDDHPITRDGVRCGLAKAGMALAVAEAGTADMARQLLDKHQPQVVLVDLHLDHSGHDRGGIELIRHLREHRPEVRILVLSQAPMTEVIRAIQAGAHGYVSKSATSAELSRAVVSVLDGPVLPPELAAVIVGEFRQTIDFDQPKLTSREQDVLRCLAKGYDNQEIAIELRIAIRTVNRHLEAIRDKLGTRRRSQLMRFAREWATA